MDGMRLSALRFPFVRMILSENRTPLFGIMRAGSESFLKWRRGGRQSSGACARRENDFSRRHCRAQGA
jgi:hypothetical protein